MSILLADPQIVELAGADAIAFAQAQFSSDLALLRTGAWQWSAWLSAQGRVRAVFHLLRVGDERLLLWLRGGSAAALRDALARFVFRARVRMAVLEGMHAVVGPLPDRALAPAQVASDRAGVIRIVLPGDPPRMLALLPGGAAAVDADASAAARDKAALADIDAGLPSLAPDLDDLLLPDWIGLGDLGATSVGKGCYPGQEIVARLHFKGGNKRWLHRISFAAPALPAPAERIQFATGGDDGIVISAAWSGGGQGRALVALRDDPARPLPAASDGIVVQCVERVSHRAWGKPI